MEPKPYQAVILSVAQPSEESPYFRSRINFAGSLNGSDE